MSGFASLSTFVYTVMVLRATLGQNATNFRFPCGPQDCADAACWNDKREWPTLNHPVSEPFFPNSKQGESKEAICDHLQAATIVVRRFGNVPSISFDRTWQDYENGFGIYGNHWLGLKHIHRLSSRSKQMISLIYRTQYGNKSHVLYGTWDGFKVDSADNLYRLSLGSSQLNIDVMQSAKGQPFYTRDKVTTPGTLRCGSRFSGGWWFGNCSGLTSDLINLNGQFNATDTDKSVFVGSHVVISAEIGIHPLHYKRYKYICDKTCPNGGTCQQASDKASYFCRCLPTFTGWRCESQVLVATSSTTPLTTTQVLVNLTSTTTLPPFIDFDTMFLYIGIGLFILICLLAIMFAGQAVYFKLTRKDDDSYDSMALLDRTRLKLWSKPKHRRKKPPQRKDTLTGESVKGTHIKRKDTLTGESVKGTHIKRKDTLTGESVKGTHIKRMDTLTGESVKGTHIKRKDTLTGESVKGTRLHRRDTPSADSVARRKSTPTAGESYGSIQRKDTQNTLTGVSVRSLLPLRTDTGCSIETTTSRTIRHSRDFTTESEKTLVRKKSKSKK